MLTLTVFYDGYFAFLEENVETLFDFTVPEYV